MRKFLFVIALLPCLALASSPPEQLISHTTPTKITRTTGTTGVEIQNLGPNAIYCALSKSSDAVVKKAREIKPGATWWAGVPWFVDIYCIAATADQVTTAGTIVTEEP